METGEITVTVLNGHRWISGNDLANYIAEKRWGDDV